MKRLITLALLIALPLALALPLSVSTASANTRTGDGGGSSANAEECMKFDGQTFAVGSNKDKQFTKLKCAKKDGGNCKVETSKKNGKQQKTPTCTEPKKASAAKAGNCSEDSDCITDPALNSDAGCTQDSCPIVENYINPFIGLLSVLVGLAIAIGIIWGGIQVTTSAGDSQKSASGKNHIRNALIGLVSYIVFYAFLQWVIPGGI